MFFIYISNFVTKNDLRSSDFCFTSNDRRSASYIHYMIFILLFYFFFLSACQHNECCHCRKHHQYKWNCTHGVRSYNTCILCLCIRSCCCRTFRRRMYRLCRLYFVGSETVGCSGSDGVVGCSFTA